MIGQRVMNQELTPFTTYNGANIVGAESFAGAGWDNAFDAPSGAEEATDCKCGKNNKVTDGVLAWHWSPMNQ
jgi:hypothetical protein